MGLIKSFTKADAKTLRDLGPAKSDFLMIDNEIYTHQSTSDLTRINPNFIVYKVAAVEFTKAPFNFQVLMDDTGQAPGMTRVTQIDWSL